MKFSFAKQRRGKLYGGYVLFCVLFCLLTYGVYWLFGYSLISTHDVLHQHVPIMIEYRKILLIWLHHLSAGPLQWSWHIGLGADAFQTFSYYIIGDPFAYLILLFNKAHLLTGFQLIGLVRMFFAGLSFTYFASHFSLKRWAIWLGAMVYLSSGFAIYASLFQPFFVNALILLPLLITAIEAVLQGRSAWGFGFVVYFSVVVNFYLAFMLALGGITYLILRWSELPHPLARQHWFNFGRMLCSGVLGLLATAWLTLPEIKALQSSPRFDVPFASGMHFYSLQYYLSLPNALLGNVNVDPFWLNTLSVNMLLLVVVWTFRHYRDYKLIVRLMVLTTVLSLLPMFAATLNGFTSPSNRWLFLMSLPMALMTGVFLQQLKSMTLNDWVPIFKWAAVILALILISTQIIADSTNTVLPQLFFLMVYAGVFVVGTVRPQLLKPQVLSALVMANIFVAFNFENAAYDIHQFLPNGAAKALISQPYGTATTAVATQPTWAEQNGTKISKYAPTFARTSNVSNYVTASAGITPNNFLLNGANISSFYSIQNGAAIQFSRDLLNNQRQLNLPIQQFDDRGRVLNFLGVRDLYANSPLPSDTNMPHNYVPTFGETPDLNQSFYGANGDVQVYQTTDNFPLMYFQSRVISNQTYKQLDANEKEANLANVTAISDTKNLKVTKLQPKGVVIPYKLYDADQNVVSTTNIADTNKSDTYTLYIPNAKQYQGMEIRALITNVHYTEPTLTDRINIDKLNSPGINGHLSSGSNQTAAHGGWDAFKRDVANGSPNQAWRISMTNGDITNSLSQMPETNLSEYEKTTAGVLNLGWVDQMPNGLSMQLGQVGRYSFDLQLVGIPMTTQYDKQVQHLQKNGLQELRLRHNEVTGLVTTKQNGVLASSIPYSAGWHATVNGHAVKLIKTNRAFMGIKLTKPGKQQIKLTYRTPGLTAGIHFTAIVSGLIAVLGIAQLGWHLFKRKKD